MTDAKRSPDARWTVDREAEDGQRYSVGDLTVWPRNMSLRLTAFHPHEYAVFPKFKAGAPKGSDQVEPGKFSVKLQVRPDASKGYLAAIGELELDEATGTGRAIFHALQGNFILTRKEAQAG